MTYSGCNKGRTMTRVVRNNKTGAYVSIDPILMEVEEQGDITQATIFNEEIDDMDDVALLEFVKDNYVRPLNTEADVDLEVVPVKIIVNCDL